MSDSRADPRTLTNVQYYRPVVPASGDEKPGDVYALCALMMGVLGMMLKNKYCAWITVFATLISIANTRRQDFDFKQTGFSIIFAVLGVAFNYVALRPDHLAAALMGKPIPAAT